MTTEGLSVHIKPRMAQNTLMVLDPRDPSRNMQYFMSGDPNTPTHWLTLVSMYISSESFVAKKSASEVIHVTLKIYQRCDRRSCMGCVNQRLMALCYAMQQCTIVKCIGTVVNQVRPLCNIGLLLQTEAYEFIALSMGFWLIFAESYANILKLSLANDNTLKVESFDDAFHGIICALKDEGAQATALITSAIGAGLIPQSRVVDSNNEQSSLVVTRTSARNTIILNGVNAFLFQLVLYPLYMIIASKKILSCTVNDVAQLVSTSGFEVTIGNPTTVNATSLIAGTCMTSFQEEEAAAGTSGQGAADAAMGASGDLAAGLLTNAQGRKAVVNVVQSALNSKAGQAVLKTAAKAATKFVPKVVRTLMKKMASRLQLGPILHIFDATLAWFSGVVSGMQVLYPHWRTILDHKT